jgi:hypothetical protein
MGSTRSSFTHLTGLIRRVRVCHLPAVFRRDERSKITRAHRIDERSVKVSRGLFNDLECDHVSSLQSVNAHLHHPGARNAAYAWPPESPFFLWDALTCHRTAGTSPRSPRRLARGSVALAPAPGKARRAHGNRREVPQDTTVRGHQKDSHSQLSLGFALAHTVWYSSRFRGDVRRQFERGRPEGRFSHFGLPRSSWLTSDGVISCRSSTSSQRS